MQINRQGMPILFCAITMLAVSSYASNSDELIKHVPNAEEGKRIAQKLCTGCHLTPDSKSTTAQDGIPTFSSIANRGDQTAQRIRNILIKPHVPMPDTQLTRNEIEDVISYLDELRDETAGPPLLTDPKTKKKKPKTRST